MRYALIILLCILAAAAVVIIGFVALHCYQPRYQLPDQQWSANETPEQAYYRRQVRARTKQDLELASYEYQWQEPIAPGKA